MADSNLCIFCGRKFTAKKNLYAHYRAVHKVQPRTRATIQCPLEGCRFACNFLSNLRIHVEKAHNTLVEKEIILFDSPEEFREWKCKEEKETKSSFVQHCGAKRTKDGSERITFVCHRSGKFQSSSTGKRLLKSQGSIKLGSHCTAAIELHRERNGSCTVTYFRTHFGHEQHIGLLQLSRSDREALARQIAKGVPFEKILDDVKSSIHSGEPERLHLITRHDLHNIKRDLCIGGTQQPGTDEVNRQNEKVDANASQLRRLVYKLQLLRSRISSGLMSRETMCKVEKEVDRLLSLTEADCRREVPHPPNNEKLKVLRISDKSNLHREDPHFPNKEKLKVLQIPEKSNIQKEVPHSTNNAKLKVLRISDKSNLHSEVPHSPNDEKMKVLQIPDKSNLHREVPHSPNDKKLKVLQIPDKSNIHKEVPHCPNKEKLKAQPIPIRPKPPPRTIILVPILAQKSDVIVKGQQDSEVKTGHVGFDHTYCQS